jgi:cytidylate kinase
MQRIIVAVDGYSSCGKSTIAKQLAKYAGYTYIDTGAMYRAVGLWTRRNGLIVGENVDEEKLKANLSNLQLSFHRLDDGTQHIFIGEEDVESQIRTLEASNDASLVSTIGFVRRRMVAMQQQMGEQKGIVMDGRDIGTVVFPNAELKIFVFARPEVRAQRRFLELTQKGEQTTYDEVLKAVEERDYRDTHRAESPLRQAEDAILLDNSDLTPEQQLNKAIELLEKATK